MTSEIYVDGLISGGSLVDDNNIAITPPVGTNYAILDDAHSYVFFTTGGLTIKSGGGGSGKRVLCEYVCDGAESCPDPGVSLAGPNGARGVFTLPTFTGMDVR